MQVLSVVKFTPYVIVPHFTSFSVVCVEKELKILKIIVPENFFFLCM